MPKELMGGGDPRSAEQQGSLRVKELNDAEYKQIVQAILELERIRNGGVEVKNEREIKSGIGQGLNRYENNQGCIFATDYPGMRFIILKDEDGLLKLIRDTEYSEYSKELVKKAKALGIGMIDKDVADVIGKHEERERNKTLFKIGEDTEEERKRIIAAVTSVESEFSKSTEGVRDEVNSALDVFFMKHRGSTGFEGCGGFNRYQIDDDGFISLSRFHSTQECIKKAKELGFKIWL